MKRFVFIISLVLMVALCLNEAQTASAAMRNLLTEFQNALKAKDLEKANSLLKEGLNVQDAFDATKTAINNYTSKGSFNEAEENFYISLITKTFKGKFKGYLISSSSFSETFSDKFLKVLLDAGMDSSCLRANLCHYLSNRQHIDKNDQNLKNLQIILKRGDSDISRDLWVFINDSVLPSFFIRQRVFGNPENLTQENLDSILLIFGILNYSAEGVEAAKYNLNKLREQYRNVPEALQYLDKVEEGLPHP